MTTQVPHGATATVRRHLDEHTSAELDADPANALIATVAALPTITSVDVYPDITRKTWGFPSGISTLATGPDPVVYPMAVPDVACGFLALATGVSAPAWNERDRIRFFDAALDQIAVESPSRRPIKIDLDAVLTVGAAAMGPPDAYDVAPDVVEYSTNCAPGSALVPESARAALAAETGSVAGHFISLYAASPLTDNKELDHGEVVLIVHTGAPALRDYLLEHHVLPMAQECIDRAMFPAASIEQGFFGLPLSYPASSDFLSIAACAVHWGQANRQLVADRLLDLLADHAPAPTLGARLIRHVGHCAYNVDHAQNESHVATNRGIQPFVLERHGTPEAAGLTFVTGSSHTHAYFVEPGPHAAQHGNRCPHGTPQWTPTRARVPGSRLSALVPDRDAVIANTEVEHIDQIRHSSNLESTIDSLAHLGIAAPAVRLDPLINYREPRYD